MADDTTLVAALERLRMAHHTFRRVSEEEVRELESLRLDAVTAEASEPPARVLAEVRLRVMERAFDILQLHRTANAPENHGWMNLLRQWGNQGPVTEFYGELSLRASPLFRGFFEQFVQGHLLPIDQDPIPHAWLAPEGSPGIFMDSGRTEPPVPAGARPGMAGIVDPKGESGPDQRYETPSGPARGPSAPNE